MSMLSGKCDLYDHISMEKMYPKYPNNENSPLVSDLMECFLIFKKKTGGVIYQTQNIKEVNQCNEELIAKRCPFFKILPNNKYEYYDKEYTAAQLKKRGGVYITVEIKFKNLLDLLPYFPYTITCAVCSHESEHITISGASYPEEEFKEGLKWGIEHNRDFYRDELTSLFKKVVLNYFNPVGREVEEELLVHKIHNCLFVEPTNEIDFNFYLDVKRDKHDYVIDLPKWIDEAGVVDVTQVWPDLKEGDTITLKYVKAKK